MITTPTPATPLHLWGRLSSINVRKVVWESNAIVRYLCARCGENTGLCPADLAQRADADRWVNLPETRPDWPHLMRGYAGLLA